MGSSAKRLVTSGGGRGSTGGDRVASAARSSGREDGNAGVGEGSGVERSLPGVGGVPVFARRAAPRPRERDDRGGHGWMAGAHGSLPSSQDGAGTPLEKPRLSKCLRVSICMWSVWNAKFWSTCEW